MESICIVSECFLRIVQRMLKCFHAAHVAARNALIFVAGEGIQVIAGACKHSIRCRPITRCIPFPAVAVREEHTSVVPFSDKRDARFVPSILCKSQHLLLQHG